MRRNLLTAVLLLFSFWSVGQTGSSADFSDNSTAEWGGGGSTYTLSATNQELTVATSKASGYAGFTWTLPSSIDLTESPYVTLSVKATSTVNLRIDLMDADGWTTNKNGLVQTISAGTDYITVTYNFSGLWYQQYSASNTGQNKVDSSRINRVVFIVNPGGAAYNGTLTIDNVKIGTSTGKKTPNPNIRLNQVGFYPDKPKTAIVLNGTPGGKFHVVSSDLNDTLWTGTLGSAATWSFSGESVCKADFSDFNQEGQFFLLVEGKGYSHPVNIAANAHEKVTKAAIKAFYYQRSSIELKPEYAGKWARPAGTPDNSVMVHNSCASIYRPTGTLIKSPGGWYDAGDYNLYVVNAGITVYTLLSSYEQYSSFFDTLNLNIPESNNTLPDILDEALWEIKWLLTMQDKDGGIYFKLSNTDFGGSIMPNNETRQRYVIKKTTSSCLNFAAVMAQSARILSRYPAYKPLADSCINAALNAWVWTKRNGYTPYVQSSVQNPAFSTGSYEDGGLGDETKWAAAEMYITTKLDSFYTQYVQPVLGQTAIPNWQYVDALPYLSLSLYQKQLTHVAADDTSLINGIIKDLAIGYKNNVQSSAYGLPLGYGGQNADFNWGSNSQAANQGFILMNAFNITKDSAYFKAALANLDYLMGRNATNYCFITGYGNQSPQNIHHRLSEADGIAEPVPGLLVGGANNKDMSDCGSASYPANSSTYPAKSYMDQTCSYATNEVAINWNAPLVYLASSIQAIEKHISPSVLTFTALTPVASPEVFTAPTGVRKSQYLERLVNLYPNPAQGQFTLETEELHIESISILDITGKELSSQKVRGSSNTININGLERGIYFVKINAEEGTTMKKLTIE